MSYSEAIEFLYTQLPMYQRVGKSAFKKDLKNIRALAGALGHPQKKVKTIHIAGTNGKGTTSHILSSLFQAEGLTVGLYTSPHYKDFRERIKLNGQLISKTEVCTFVDRIRPLVKTIKASFFEITVAMAFSYFEKKKVDIAIIETGLGGRLDSTNIILPELSVITNIGFDHQDMLGNTLPLIAAEKAGIIKAGVPVVIGEKQRGIQKVFKARAKECGAPLDYAETICEVTNTKTSKDKSQYNITIDDVTLSVRTDLNGPFQEKNIRTALSAYSIYKKNQDEAIQKDTIKYALTHLKKLTGYMGRWHIKRLKPLTILDSGHNIDGITQAIAQLSSTPHDKLHFVLGFVRDKHWEGLLSLFPIQAHFYFCKPSVVRGLDRHILQSKAESMGYKGRSYSTVKGAERAALRQANDDHTIFIGGSTFVVAEVV